MTDPQPARTPYCHKIRYGITGAPILTADEMDGSHAPGVGLKPTRIELAYHAARDGQPARVDASVTGDWTRFGEPDGFGGQMTTHFKSGPDGWPVWLAAEARLHDPAVPDATPHAGRGAEPVCKFDEGCHRVVPCETGCGEFGNLPQRATAPAVLPPPADRAAVLREVANFVRGLLLTRTLVTTTSLEAELLRMADEAQQEPEYTESVIYEVVGDWGVDSADSAEGARAAVAKWLRAYPKCGAYAQQRIYRDWPDGSEYYGPWTDLPAAVPAVGQTDEEASRG